MNMNKISIFCISVLLFYLGYFYISITRNDLSNITKDITTIDSTVYYYYDYPWDNHSHMDDNIIKFIYKDGIIISGYFWGTSDEFCESREGFHPGFFMLPIKDIKQDSNKLSFSIDSRNTPFFNKPIDVMCTPSHETMQDNNYLWKQNQKLFQDSVCYEGIFLPNEFIIHKEKSKFPYFEDHRFIKMDLDTIKEIYK